MSILKLNKLMYLTDRESLNRYGYPATYDCMVAMPFGPVLTLTKNYIDGSIQSQQGGWDDWVSDRADHEVCLNAEVSGRDDFDELSDADIAVLDKVWGDFGQMTRWQLVDYTHAHCAEWNDPNGSCTPIKYSDVLMALGKPQKDAVALENEIESHRSSRSAIFQ